LKIQMDYSDSQISSSDSFYADPDYLMDPYVSLQVHRVIYSTFQSVILSFQSDLKMKKIYYLCEGVIMGLWRARTSGFEPYTPQQALDAIKDCKYLELDPSKTPEDMDPKLYKAAVEEYHAEVKQNPEGFKAMLQYKGY